MSTNSQSQKQIEQLRQMPKAPIEGLELALGRQFFWCSLIGLIFPLSAGACYTLSVYSIREEHWWTIACILFTVSLVVSIFWLGFLGQLIRDKRQLTRFANGYYLASWRVPRETWDATPRETRAVLDDACWWIFRIVPAIGFLGAIFGVMLDVVAGGESGMDVLPVILPWGLNTIGYTVIGVIVAWTIVRCVRFIANARLQIEENGVPMVVVSEAALYITGRVFRKSLHVTLVDVTLDASKDHLNFVYESIGETVNRTAVAVPVPPEEERTTKALMRILSRKS